MTGRNEYENETPSMIGALQSRDRFAAYFHRNPEGFVYICLKNCPKLTTSI